MKNSAVRLSPRAVIYPFLWAFSLVFTQMLRNRVSNAFFLFVCIFPVLSIAYALIGRSFVQVYVSSDVKRTEKCTPVEYEIRLINSSPFPLPRVEALVSEPDKSGVRCFRKKLVTSLVSFGGCVIRNTVVFPYRGSYDIGVESVYVYGLLGMVAFRMNVSNYAHVTVFPRSLPIERGNVKNMTDDAFASAERKNTSELSEPSDLKDYSPGDPIKSIHWKLSSKAQDIKVRKYDSVEQKHTYIFCDLSGATRLPEKTPAEVLESVKKALSPRKNLKSKKLRTLKTRVAALAEAERESEAAEEKSRKKAFSGMRAYFRVKKAEREFRRNVKRGMTEEQAETVKMVDELIFSNSKAEMRRRRTEEKRSDRYSEKKEKALFEYGREQESITRKEEAEQSELEKILKSTAEKEAKLSKDEKLFGGRVKPEFSEDHDEMCADAVVELTVALALDEISLGNRCTVVWFDEREESGIAAYGFSTPYEFEPVYFKLSTAPVVSPSLRVSSLTAAVGDVTTSKIKVVTSNIDPVSLGETEQMPAKLGGVGSGCNAEVLIFSPCERYEDPSERAAFSADAENRLISKGITCNIWTEGLSGTGGSAFVAIG